MADVIRSHMQETSERALQEARFAAFVQSHRERAVRVAWRLVGGDQAAAEDVAQEAFMRAHRSLASFRSDASLSTWFYKILTRQAYNYRRWRRVRMLWQGLWNEDEADPRPAPGQDPGLRKRLEAALEDLSPQQREAFVLIHLEGFTVTETAELLGRSPGTIKSHLHRALASLRLALGDLHLASEETMT